MAETTAEAGRRTWRVGAAVVAALMLAGCTVGDTSVRKTLGLDQAPPDEFLVVNKPPLTVPPDMQLLPPEPGAPGAASDPRRVAEAAALGNARGAGTNASSGERALLAKVGADEADPRIRRRLTAEALQAKEAEDTISGRLLGIEREQTETLDPEEEKERLRRQRTGRRISAEDILASDTR